MSLPSRERGLKFRSVKQSAAVPPVAPFAGAWIEIGVNWSKLPLSESSLPSRERGLKCRSRSRTAAAESSLPSRERGLKCENWYCNKLKVAVAPFAGAWIEICVAADGGQPLRRSLPSRERGLKYGVGHGSSLCNESLPSRERGLKYPRTRLCHAVKCRSLRGSVD